MRFIALLLLAAAPLFSQAAAAQDVPGRVGRVSYIDGSVSVYHDPEIGWERAFVNSPVTSENSVWTDPGSRAEMRVSAVAVRLDEATQLDVSRLDDEEMDASIVRGSVAVRIRHNEYGSRFVFDTPEARFTLTREGRYRIDVDADAQETRLAVFAGEASMETAEGVRRIPAGRMVALSDGEYRFDRAYLTDFDGWSRARDRSWVEGPSVRYVSTFMTGYEELDPYGQWIQDPVYGPLWMPTQVSEDWVPYRYGRWSYVRPWGWTWIDDQPWGYAPFHYGRWVHVRERWCWYPGRREARPTWAPALVAWVGGSNWSVGVSTGSPVMGWYPLAPNERYQPWYHADERYVSRVNNIVVNNITINNFERRAPQEVNRTLAVTAVPRENLIERKPVQQAMVRVTQDVARSAPPVQPQAVMPNNSEIQRMHAVVARTAPATVASPPAPSMPSASAPSRAQGAQPGQGGNAAVARQRPGQPAAAAPSGQAPQAAAAGPVGPLARPSFARPQNTPPPAPAAAATNGQPAQRAPRAQPAQPQQGQPAQPAVPAQPAQANPASRGNAGRERADQVHERNAEQQQQQQLQQQEAQRRAAEAQQRQQQQQQEQQRRAAEAQQRQQQQQQQQQQEQQRRAAEAQQRQQDMQRQQQEAQRQAEQQRRAAEAQQRRAQEAQRQQQEAQQRQQQEAQRQQQEAQRRAAEAQRAQQPAPHPVPQAAPQAAPKEPQGNPASRGEERKAHPHPEKPEDEKGKGQ